MCNQTLSKTVRLNGEIDLRQASSSKYSLIMLWYSYMNQGLRHPGEALRQVM